MLLKTDGTTFQVYSTCFAVLAIPGAITLVLLFVTKRKFPNPEHFEPEPKEYVPFKMKKEFVLYIAGISLFAFGFIDYSLVLMHVSRTYTHLASGLAQTSALVSSGSLPLLYAGAMLVDAVAALVFGLLYDKRACRRSCGRRCCRRRLRCSCSRAMVSARCLQALRSGASAWARRSRS